MMEEDKLEAGELNTALQTPLCELDRIVFSQAFQPDVGYLVT